MRIQDLFRLKAGTTIFGLSYQDNNETYGICVLDTHSWDPRIITDVRFTYFPDSFITDLREKTNIKVSYHSEYILPFFDQTTVKHNHQIILSGMTFGDSEGHFKPKEFIGVLLGETILGSDESDYSGFGTMPRSRDEPVWSVEAFTKILLSDRIVWLRLWNYINSSEMVGLNRLEDVPLKLTT